MAYISKEYEIYGTWVNPEYNYEAKYIPKFIVHPNGKTEDFSTDTSNTVYESAELVITNKWTDSKGNIWYTYIGKGTDAKFWRYYLVRISNSGKTWESADSPNDYPKEIDPNNPYTRYAIYYRQ